MLETVTLLRYGVRPVTTGGSVPPIFFVTPNFVVPRKMCFKQKKQKYISPKKVISPSNLETCLRASAWSRQLNLHAAEIKPSIVTNIRTRHQPDLVRWRTEQLWNDKNFFPIKHLPRDSLFTVIVGST